MPANEIRRRRYLKEFGICTRCGTEHVEPERTKCAGCLQAGREWAWQCGFFAYSVADCGNGTVISLAAFENREAAEATSQRAMAWAEQTMRDIPDPEVIRTELKLRIVNEAALPKS
jgi:hypothetical protein